MIHQRKGLDLEITDFEYQLDRTATVKLHHLKPPKILEIVEIVKIQVKPKYDTLLGRS